MLVSGAPSATAPWQFLRPDPRIILSWQFSLFLLANIFRLAFHDTWGCDTARLDPMHVLSHW
jgi:hypothetical protein